MENAALTIAGSDSSSGAGIQADLKTFLDFGIYATTAITAITAQNTTKISDIHYVPIETIASQIEAVVKKFSVRAVKIGMLGTKEITKQVAALLAKYKIKPVVIDPLLLSTSGTLLLTPDGFTHLIEHMFPLCELVTPNIYEAEVISEIPIDSIGKMRQAADEIHKKGAKQVLITGGYFDGKIVDIFFDGTTSIPLFNKKIDVLVHGTGCMLTAAITAQLAKGIPVLDAVTEARQYVYTALQQSLLENIKHPDLKKTKKISTTSFHAVLRLGEKRKILLALETAVFELKKEKIGHLIPEIQSNLVYALPNAKKIDDVASFPGRIIKLNQEVYTIKPAAFGYSRHVAHIILAAMKIDTSKRAAMNIAYNKDILDALNNLDYKIESFDRDNEPADIKNKEGSTLAWGVESVITRLGYVPDIIYDIGEKGKEPVIRIIADSPADIVGIIKKIMKNLQ